MSATRAKGAGLLLALASEHLHTANVLRREPEKAWIAEVYRELAVDMMGAVDAEVRDGEVAS